jgi:alkyldihydroxyacetonephosphate synthase
MSPVARRCWWGWGNEGDGLSSKEMEALAAVSRESFSLAGRTKEVPPLDSLELPRPRVEPPGSLGRIFFADVLSRASHSYGKSYRDVVRALAGRIDHPVDLVARPRNEIDVENVLSWCSSAGIAVIPFGGGSSVVGGVEPDVGTTYNAAVSLDLGALDSVLEVDSLSAAARIGAGALGPHLEEQLRAHGLTLRHFPQSFEFSTLGGWIATRSGGHFATGPTHIDDLVESVRILTPAGPLETRRLPASGAGPSPDRLVLGSEGALGVITEAWMRVRPRPRWRAGGPALFESFSRGAQCVRSLAQSGLQPSNCRLIDPLEALLTRAGDGTRAVLLLGFESADHPLEAWADRAAQIVKDHGGEIAEQTWRSSDEQSASASEGRGEGSPTVTESWRSAFLRAPYVRDALVRLGVLCETFETAITWDRFEELHAVIMETAIRELASAGSENGLISCRLTHAYPDGAAPYFTVLAPAKPGAEVEQWDEVKEAVSEVLLAAGATITHHHAVGRDHRRWYERQRPPLFATAFRAAKSVLDPAGVCNPGVLVEARS